jgi:glutaconate CoA-transferase subunit A
MARRSLLTPLAAAVAGIPDGAVVGIGGAITAGHPMALVRALARRGARELTLVTPTAGIEVDLLIACGCVRRVIASYVGIETVAGVGPVFRRAAERGEIEVVDLDEAHCVAGLRAAGQGLPFLPWRGGVGTSFTQLSPELAEFQDPLRGETLLAIPPLALDVALLHAERADVYGNAQPVGTAHMDPLLAAAAERVVLQVDSVITNDELRRHPERTLAWRTTAVVRAPFGTHPYSSAALIADEQHLREFAAAAREHEQLQRYLETHILDDHDAYLEAVGVRRLTALLV